MFVQQMLIPRDVWELAATVPLPKISKTASSPTSKIPSPTPRISSPTSPTKTLANSGDPLKSTEPSSLLQQSSALLHKTLPPGQPVSEETTVEDWIAAAPWVQVCLNFAICRGRTRCGLNLSDNEASSFFQAFLNSPWLQEAGGGGRPSILFWNYWLFHCGFCWWDLIFKLKAYQNWSTS